MHLETLGIHESVGAVFPPLELRAELAALPVQTVVVDDPADCDAVVTFSHRDTFTELEWIHSIQAGVDRFPQDRLGAEGIMLTNSTGIHGDAVGETVAGYVLAFARRLHRHVANQQDTQWRAPDWDEAWTVAGERAVVVGLGGLGRGVVDRLTGLGMTVDGVRRRPLPEPGVDSIYTAANLTTAVSDARFVVLAVPLTDRTRGMIGSEVFAQMREDAYIINVSRGQVVDQSALVEALESGAIAGAALDVFEAEPLPDDSPLWEMDEVIVSPHSAAFTRDYHEHIAALVRENVTRIRDGEPLVNRVV